MLSGMIRRDLDAYVFVAILNAAVFFLFSTQQLKLDYKAFYSAGRVAIVSPANVYNSDRQFSSAGLWDSKDKSLTYYHAPHELLIFGPLSLLPYRMSLAIWRLLSATCFSLACFLLARVYELPFKQTVVFSAALFGVTFCLLEGQDSLLLLLLLSTSLYLARNGSDLSAGCLLGIALFKPQVPIVVAIAMFISGRRRFSSGFLSTAIFIAVASFAVIRTDGSREMLELLHVAEMREVPGQMISLRGLFSFLGAENPLPAVIASLSLIAAFVPLWRRLQNLTLMFSSAILVGALTAFHFHGQDLAILLIPVLWLACRPRLGPAAKTAIWSLYLSPFFMLLLYWGLTGILAISVSILTLEMWRDIRTQSAIPSRQAEQCP
jgi:hypothetical protein